MNVTQPSESARRNEFEPFMLMIRNRPSLRQESVQDPSKFILKTRINKLSIGARIQSDQKKMHNSELKVVNLGPRLALSLARPPKSAITKQRRSTVNTSKMEAQIDQISKANGAFLSEWNDDANSFDQILLKNSSKLKLIHNSQRPELSTALILSAEFLLNELSFWKDEVIDCNTIKTYRNMSKKSSLVWLIKKQKTAQKLILFCKRNQLPLDGIYLIKKSAKVSIGVNYEPITQDFSSHTKFLVFDIVRAHSSAELNDFHYLDSKLPLALNKQVRLHLIKTDREFSPSKMLGNVWQILLGSLQTRRLSLDKTLEGYMDYLKNCSVSVTKAPKNTNYCSQKIQIKEEENIEESVMNRIGLLKKQWIPELNQTKQFSKGHSVHYIVGDILKKNFRLMVDFHKQSVSKAQDKADSKTATTGLSRRGTITRVEDIIDQDSIRYDIPVYVCSM